MRILLIVRDMLKVGKQNLLGHHYFVSEFAKYHEVIWWGPLRDGYDENRPITDVVSQYKPDIIFKYGFRMPFEIDMDKVTIPKLIYLVDYFPPKGNYRGCQPQYQEYMERSKYDLAFVPVSYMGKYVVECGACRESFLMPFSVNTKVFRKRLNFFKEYDVCARYTIRDDVYPLRAKLLDMLSTMNVSYKRNKTTVSQYVDDINYSRIVVTSNNIFGSLSRKYTEVMACGSFLLADKPEDLKEFGYIDGKHLVIYNGLNDLRKKILYYLEQEHEREWIANNGMEFVRKHYNNKVMVDKFTDLVCERWMK